MSDTDNQRPRKPLTLRGSQPGEVKQTFSQLTREEEAALRSASSRGPSPRSGPDWP
ncbi:hypothetical protein J4558_04515 [Leptolyngbya sp. 15MV]|nr:hypothetical protein J4558_04515 [Leptolyngbya sp. 15MV]